MIGHNRGPALEGGACWRVHCWRQARAALLPHLPVEVVRTRVGRAAELGLDYRTYAGVRAATGHDLVAFLFSSNALRLLAPAPVLPQDRAEKLAALRACARIVLVQPPLAPPMLAEKALPLDALQPAPRMWAADREARATIRAALGRLPADTVLLVGDGALEHDWCAAARLAGYLPAERFFPAA